MSSWMSGTRTWGASLDHEVSKEKDEFNIDQGMSSNLKDSLCSQRWWKPLCTCSEIAKSDLEQQNEFPELDLLRADEMEK